jgi:hypothetical protein
VFEELLKFANVDLKRQAAAEIAGRALSGPTSGGAGGRKGGRAG